MKAFLTPIARNLRKQNNPHEVKMWARFRNRNFLGIKFHRQFRIGPYVVDFCCREKQLIIELDGGGHDEQAQRTKDLKRDAYLASQGYRVIRIWTTEMENGLEALLQELQDTKN